jgi:hypothetical protein
LRQHCKNADCNEHLLATIKESLFSDFDGIIKSLGAWGGDFVMAADHPAEYFAAKGYETIVAYEDMILS